MIGPGYASTTAIKAELAEAGNARVGIGFILWALERNPAVQTLAQARQAAKAGADIIIAQGRDAGGHSGTTRGTIALVPAVVDAVAPIPVVAAGGIADGRGAPWPEIYPGRALKNAFSAEWHGREDELAARRGDVEKEYLATPGRRVFPTRGLDGLGRRSCQRHSECRRDHRAYHRASSGDSQTGPPLVKE